METQPSNRPKGPFRFLSHDEFAALPREVKVVYLRLAIQAVSSKVDGVLGEKNAAKPAAC